MRKKRSKKISQIFIGGLLLVTIFPALAQASAFTDKLIEFGRDLDELRARSEISRFETTELLNAVQCRDCIFPAPELRNSRTDLARQNLKTNLSLNIDDIFRNIAEFESKNFFYCVATTVSEETMRGYPRENSRICPGEFCGARATTHGELIQILANLLAQHRPETLEIDRRDADRRASDLTDLQRDAIGLTARDLQIFAAKRADCGRSDCPATSRQEFLAAQKFCRENLDACSMEEISPLREWLRPIAALNAIRSQGLGTGLDPSKIFQPVPGSVLLQNLEKIFEIIDCRFDPALDDHDCDGIPNRRDNCPNDFNPSQKNLDRDDTGDACDEDIDNDGILNTPGLVDESGRIDPTKLATSDDNCPLTPNTDQRDQNFDGRGDACDPNSPGNSLPENSQKSYLTIAGSVTDGWLTPTIRFDANSPDPEIFRFLNENFITTGRSRTHEFQFPGFHTISARSDRGARALASVIVPDPQEKTRLLSPSIRQNSDSREILADSDRPALQRSTDGQSRKFLTTAQLQLPKKDFPKNFLLYLRSTRDDETAVAFAHLRSDQIFQISLQNSALTRDQPIFFAAQLTPISPDAIEEISRDFGDGNTATTTGTLASHEFRQPGIFTVQAKLTTTDGREFFAATTLQFADPRRSRTQIFALDGDADGQLGQPNFLNLQNLFRDEFFRPEILLPARSFGRRSGKTLARSTDTPGQNFLVISSPHDACIDQLAAATTRTSDPISCHPSERSGQNFSDLDGDGIPDLCDSDIDGDGQTNLLGLLTKNAPQNFDRNSRPARADALNRAQFDQHRSEICSLDPCPFTTDPATCDAFKNFLANPENFPDGNSDQNLGENPDGNSDQNSATKDRDGDGIPDDEDACPDEPENFNFREDEDGCPESTRPDPRCDPNDRKKLSEFLLDSSSPLRCQITTGTPGDSIDNDCDGRIDEEILGDGIDNDGDGQIDEDDSSDDDEITNDSDGDGVTDDHERRDGTDPDNFCDFRPNSQTTPPSQQRFNRNC